MTALTLIGTVSLVITSCAGTSILIVRKLTFTIRSMIGIRIIRPGPFAPTILPKRKITPLSYSLTILIAWDKIMTITIRIPRYRLDEVIISILFLLFISFFDYYAKPFY